MLTLKLTAPLREPSGLKSGRAGVSAHYYRPRMNEYITLIDNFPADEYITHISREEGLSRVFGSRIHHVETPSRDACQSGCRRRTWGRAS